jgi:hypothetical protein
MADPPDYEERWPELRTEWARQKIQDWIGRLRIAGSEAESKILKQDIANPLLRDWEAR